MGIRRSFDIMKLKSFRREGSRIPAPEKEDQVFELDHDLRPEEQAYINHYIGYADILLEEPEEGPSSRPESLHANVIELPQMQEPTQTQDIAFDDESKAA